MNALQNNEPLQRFTLFADKITRPKIRQLERATRTFREHGFCICKHMLDSQEPSPTEQSPPAAQKRQESDNQRHAYYLRRLWRDDTQNGLVQGAEGAQRQVRRFDQVRGKGSENSKGVRRLDGKPRQDAPYGAHEQEQDRAAGRERDVWLRNQSPSGTTSTEEFHTHGMRSKACRHWARQVML